MSEESNITEGRRSDPPPLEQDLPPMPSLILRPRCPWSREQLWFVFGQFWMLLGVYIALRLRNRHYTDLLHCDPVGLWLLLGTALLMLMNSCSYLGFCYAMNRATADDERAESRKDQLLFALAVLHLVVFFLPAVVAVAFGPAFISMLRNGEL
jgi:hypothetical protein